MQRTVENSRDAEMLKRIDLSPLDAADAGGEEPLAQLVEQHNALLAELVGRFRQLADGRAALADADKWLDRDGAEIVTERGRVATESWDVLVAVRKALGERQELLQRLEAQVAREFHDVAERREQAVDKARKSLEREHRSYLKAEPIRGQAYVADLADEDDTVVELGQQEHAVGRTLEHLQSLRRKAASDVSAVLFRQRDAFSHLN
jgi:hypothetical protein